jgi:hypothetical protein
MKEWEIIADRLSKAGWSLGWVSAVDSQGRTIWIVDAHRDDGRRFIVSAEEKLTAFVELESAIPAALGKQYRLSNWLLIDSFRLGFGKELLKPWIATDWIPDGVDL